MEILWRSPVIARCQALIKQWQHTPYVTRLQAGRLQLHIEPGDLIALARRVITRLQMTTEQHTLLLQTPLPYLIILYFLMEVSDHEASVQWTMLTIFPPT